MTVFNLVLENLLKPSATRLGTFGAGLLVSVGMNVDHAAQVGVGITALAFFAIDLGLAYLRKRSIINKTYMQTAETILNGRHDAPYPAPKTGTGN